MIKATLIKENIQLMLAYSFSPLSTWQKSRQHVGRHDAGGASLHLNPHARGRETLGLAWAFETSKATPSVIYFQEGHKYSNKATFKSLSRSIISP